MRKIFVIILVAMLFFTCSSNKKNKTMDCSIEKITITENESNFLISDPKTIQQIKELVVNRKKDLFKFKPKYWVEMIGPSCTLKFGVQKTFLKIDGVSYLLNEDLEKIISESLQRKTAKD